MVKILEEEKMTKEKNCGRCKCYICGHPNCARSLCRGSHYLENCRERPDCGRFLFDSEKLRDVLLGEKKSAVI